MFGDEYNIVRHFPKYFLDYREELDPTTRWSDRLRPVPVNNPNIFNVWADEGWEEPIIEERFDPDRTVLSLSFVKKEDAKMKEDSNFIQKNERSLKEVLNHKDYEKILPIIEYLETNSAITTQMARQITGKSLATAWR